MVYLSSTVGVLLASPLELDEDPLPDFPPSAPFLLPKRGILLLVTSSIQLCDVKMSITLPLIISEHSLSQLFCYFTITAFESFYDPIKTWAVISDVCIHVKIFSRNKRLFTIIKLHKNSGNEKPCTQIRLAQIHLNGIWTFFVDENVSLRHCWFWSRNVIPLLLWLWSWFNFFICLEEPEMSKMKNKLFLKLFIVSVLETFSISQNSIRFNRHDFI